MERTKLVSYAELEWNLGKEKLEGKDPREMGNKIGNFWKKRRDLRKERRSTFMDRKKKDVITGEEQKRSVDCNLLSSEINVLYSVLREIKS